MSKRLHTSVARILTILFLASGIGWGQEPEAPKEKLPEGVIGTFGVGRFRAGGQLMGIQLSPDGKQLATNNASNLVRIWDVATGRLLSYFDAKAKDAARFDWLKPWPSREERDRGGGAAPDWARGGARVARFGASGDKKVLVTAEEQGLLKLWDAVEKASIGEWATSEKVTDIVLSHDGSVVSTGALYGGNRVRLWRVKRPAGKPADIEEILPDDGHTAGITSLAFTGDGRHLLSSSIDNTARFWNVATRREVARLDFSSQVSLSSKLNRLGVHGINDGTGASIYDATKPEALVPLEEFPDDSQVAISPDGKRAAIMGRGDKSPLKIWDMEARQEVCRFDTGTFAAYELQWSPDGKKVVFGGTALAVLVWDVDSGKKLLEAQEASAQNLTVSADSRFLIAARDSQRGGQTKPVQVWNLSTGKLERDFGTTEHVLGFLALPDNRRVIGACYDGKLRVWDLANGTLLKTIDAHTTWAYELALHPNGRSFVSGAIDSTILHWDIAVLPEVPAK